MGTDHQPWWDKLGHSWLGLMEPIIGGIGLNNISATLNGIIN